MPKPPALDAFHQHEVLHGVAMIQSLFDEWIERHSYTHSEPDVRAAAEEIGAKLADLYQMVGRKSLSEDDQ